MLTLFAIITALIRGHVVGCIVSRNGRLNGVRFTVTRIYTGRVCVITNQESGFLVWYDNIADFYTKHKDQIRLLGCSVDAAIIDDVKQEQEFLAGREAAAKLLDPPVFLKAA